MTRSRAVAANGEAGFTLIETLIALALMGLVLSSLATITAQWLPAWNHGVDRIQRTEMLELALRRVSDDLAAAEFVYANREQTRPLFEGSELAVTFVRTAIGPNAPRGLEVVRIGDRVFVMASGVDVERDAHRHEQGHSHSHTHDHGDAHARI